MTPRENVVNVILISRMTQIIQDTDFMDYQFFTELTGAGEVTVRARYQEPDTYTNEPSEQLTRRWILNPSMTDSELVSTLFKCAITSMEHRTREAFQYKKARIYGPHFHVDDLVRLCIDEQRENAGGRDAV